MAVYRYDPNDPEGSRISAGLRAAGVGAGTTAPQVRTQLDPDESYLKWTAARDAKAIEDWKNQTQNDMKSFWSALSGAGSGVSASDSLARRKYEDELAKEKRQIEAYQQMLQGGGYRAGADRMLGLINEQGKVSEGAAKKAYTDALANILGGFETAQSLTGEGYGALENYLRQNPNNPYADVRVSAGQAPDAMEQILSAYGVSADPVRAQVAAEQAAAQQGAAGFQNLLNTLGASAQQSDASRLAEMMMAQNLAQTTLGQQRFGYQSQAEQAQANALAQIQAQLAQARLEQEAGVETRRQGIEDAIAAAGGNIPETGATGSDKDKDAEAAKSRAIEQLAAKAGTVKDKKLAARIEAFVEANPNAGIAKIRKEFPALAKNLK
jgi:hypothetical protein